MGRRGRGRIDATGTCVLYFTRAEIEDGALAGKGLELAWAADPVELFFLEIQGSGRIQSARRQRDAGRLRRPERPRICRHRAACCATAESCRPGGATMQSIKDWIRANPDQGRALMRENLSYVFFKELTGPGRWAR